MKVSAKVLLGILALCALPALPLAAQTSQNALDQVVDKIVTTENADVQKLRDPESTWTSTQSKRIPATNQDWIRFKLMTTLR